MDIKEYEIRIWEAAKSRNVQAFSALVEKDAVMVCGGFRCSGADYTGLIQDFDTASYEIKHFEVIYETADLCQVHYIISTKAANEKNKDLEGTFHITSTWKRTGDTWKLIFNMDSRCE